MKKILLSIAVAGLFLATGCSKSPVDQIVSICDEYAGKIDKAADCEEAQGIAMEYVGKLMELGETISDTTDLSESEQQRVEEATTKVQEAIEKKCGE